MSMHKVLLLIICFVGVFAFLAVPTTSHAQACGPFTTFNATFGSCTTNASGCDGILEDECFDLKDFFSLGEFDYCDLIGQTYYCFDPPPPDTTDPIITVTQAPAGATTANPITISSLATDIGGTGMAEVRVDVDLNGNGFFLDPGESKTCTAAGTNTLFCSHPVGTLSVGTYKYAAIGKDVAGNVAITGVKSFTVTASGGSTCSAPNLTSSGFQCQNKSPSSISFGWSSVSGATQYEVQVCANSSFTTGCQTVPTAGAATLQAVTGLSAGTQYWARVQVKDTSLSCTVPGSWSEAWSCRTTGGTTYPAPTTPTPANGSSISDTQPTLQWNSTGAPMYQIQALDSSNNELLTGLEQYSSINQNSALPRLTVGDYRWRVASCQTGSESGNCISPEWSSYWEFTVTSAGAFTITPGSGVITNFGSQDVGTPSTARSFTINNTTGSTVSVEISTQGANACDFKAESGSNIVGTCTTNGSIVVSDDQSRTVNVVFTPSDEDNRSGHINFAPDTGGNLLRQLRGTGVSSDGDTFSISPSQIDCGSVVVGTAVACPAFILANNSGQNIVLSSMTVAQGLDGIFIVPTNTSVNVSDGDSVPLRFSFIPVNSILYTANITFQIDDESGSSLGTRIQEIKGLGSATGCTADGGSCTKNSQCCSLDCDTVGICVTPGNGGEPPDSEGVLIEFENPLGDRTFEDLTTSIIDFLFTISLIIAPILLVVAGVMFMTAAGDPARVALARKMLLWTIVGFGIIVVSKGLVEVLKGIIGIQ